MAKPAARRFVAVVKKAKRKAEVDFDASWTSEDIDYHGGVHDLEGDQQPEHTHFDNERRVG